MVYDSLFELIRVLDPSFDISQFANKQASGQILSVLEKVKPTTIVSPDLHAVLQTIIQKGLYTVKGTQKIVTTYEDGREINRDVGEIISNLDLIVEQLQSYMQKMKDILERANTDLQNGTVKLLYQRARQMGYSVKEERKGTQVQLVLVRTE